MPSTLSSRALQELYATSSPEAWLLLVTVTHASLTDPFRVVDNNEPVISRGVTFQPFWFTLQLPDDTRERPAEFQFVLDAVMLPLLSPLRSITTPMQMLVEMVSSARPDNVELTMSELVLRGVQWNSQQMVFRAVHEDLLNARFPADQYAPQRYPGIFR